jgi:Fe-S-cluster containining protein
VPAKKKGKGRKKQKLVKSNPCHGCGGACCGYISIYVEEPADLEEYGVLEWYLHHKKVCVYVDQEESWYVHVETECSKVDKKGRCTIYEARPTVCRDYQPDACERAETGAENIAEFYSVEELRMFFDHNFRLDGEDLERKRKNLRAP